MEPNSPMRWSAASPEVFITEGQKRTMRRERLPWCHRQPA
jgi:hypothetical protein